MTARGNTGYRGIQRCAAAAAVVVVSIAFVAYPVYRRLRRWWGTRWVRLCFRVVVNNISYDNVFDGGNGAAAGVGVYGRAAPLGGR